MIDVMRMVLPVFLAVGCAGEELPGSYFDVERVGANNGCTGNGTNFRETWDYRLEYRNTEVSLAIGPDVWAAGDTDGCDISYRSIVWTSQRDGFAIDWRVSGTAQVDPDGGNVCNSDLDWIGTEVYEVTNSEHPDVNPGCTYTVDVTGKHFQTLE